MHDQGSRHGVLQSGSSLHSSGLQLAASVRSSASACATAHWPARDAVSCTSNAGNLLGPRRSCVSGISNVRDAAASKGMAHHGSKPGFPAPRSLFCRPLAGDLAGCDFDVDANILGGSNIQPQPQQPAAAAGLGSGKLDLGRLQLTRPLVVFDLETTGLSTKCDRIAEFGAVRVLPDGSYTELRFLLNPAVRIDKRATAAHGYTAEKLSGQPRFADVAQQIVNFFRDADVLGYNNIRFDGPILAAELARLSAAGTGGCQLAFPLKGAIDLDALRLYQKTHKRVGKVLDKRHTALGDAHAALEVLCAMLRDQLDLPATIAELHSFVSPGQDEFLDRGKCLQMVAGEAIFTKGKYAGKLLRDNAAEHPEYMHRIAAGARRWWGAEAEHIIQQARRGVFPGQHLPQPAADVDQPKAALQQDVPTGVDAEVPGLSWKLRAAAVEGRPVDGGKRLIWAGGHAVFTIRGTKHCGRRLEWVAANDPQYLRNIMWRTRTWGADTKRILEDAQRGVFPQPPELWL